MTLDQIFSLLSALIAFAGLIFVAIQIREATRQKRIESVQRLFDSNRELLTLSFNYPELSNVISDRKADPELERRYLQMWLNQIALIHTMLRHKGLDGDFREGLERDFSDLLSQENMQRHWLRCSDFYPESFRNYVNGLIAKASGF